MASRSPAVDADAGALADPQSYLQGWGALGELVEQDYSWSGHERNCVFRNLGGGGFGDVSAISGLDFDDDGRACVGTDLDGDGDVDLVFKNRSGPQLRFLRNDVASGPSLMIRLRDPAGGNRDAIGARVELHAGDRLLVRCVTAGDGYLGQASRWLHFGLDGSPPPERCVVRWPDGVESRHDVPAGARRVRIERGAAAALPDITPLREPAVDDRPLPPLPDSEVVVLREPLLLPPTLARVAFRGPARRPAYVALWSRSCERCAAEIAALAAGHREIERAGVDLVFLGLHDGKEQAAAAVRFRELLGAHGDAARLMRQRPASAAVRGALSALLEATLGRTGLSTPTGLLVDGKSRVQAIYFGEVGAERLAADAMHFGLANIAGTKRSNRDGRWAFEVQRALAPFARALARRGLQRDAAFVAQLAEKRRESPGAPK